jgi:hypothetical protein
MQLKDKNLSVLAILISIFLSIPVPAWRHTVTIPLQYDPF